MKSLNCPFPCSERAVSLNQNLKNRLKESLEHLVEIHKDKLGGDYNTWKQALSYINPDKIISSFYYSLNSLLAHATMSEAMNDIVTIAPYIKELPTEPVWEQGPLNQRLRFLSFDNQLKRAQIQKKYILFDLPAQADIESPDQASAETIQFLVTEAIKLIATTDTEYYQEMSALISEILILKSEYLKAGSSFDLFGMIYINITNAKKSVLNMVDLLIHETAHYYLYSLSVDDPLVLNDYQERYFSPIKGRVRPMIGIYHAAFVLFRVLKFLSLLNQKLTFSIDNPINSETALTAHREEQIEIEALNARYSSIVSESLETVFKFGKLTELGEKLIKETEKEFMALTENNKSQVTTL